MLQYIIMHLPGETGFGDLNGNVGGIAVGSGEWFAAASNEQVIDVVYEEYVGLASRIDELVISLPEDERVHHMGAKIRHGDTRAFLIEDDILGDFPIFAGRASERFREKAQETGDFSQWLSLTFNLEDPVLARNLLDWINLRRVSPEAFSSTGNSDLDHLSDPDLQFWRYVRRGMAERRNKGIDEFQAALTSHARREARFAVDGALRQELNEDGTGMVRSLGIAVFVQRLVRRGGNRQARQVRKLIKKQLEELSEGTTIP
jgi:hypothetical protein